MLLRNNNTFRGKKNSDLACIYAGFAPIIGDVFANCFHAIAILR